MQKAKEDQGMGLERYWFVPWSPGNTWLTMFTFAHSWAGFTDFLFIQMLFCRKRFVLCMPTFTWQSRAKVGTL